MYSLWRHGHLDKRQLMAWKRFIGDVEASEGDSGPLTVSYTERVSTSVSGAPRTESDRDEDFNARGVSGMRLAYWNTAWASHDEVWSTLREEERAIVEQLIRDHLKIVRGLKIHGHDLAYIGNFFCGYKDNRQALSAAVSKVQSILKHLAYIYML
jgi:hypothetical protein